jgi:hypothetical protein
MTCAKMERVNPTKSVLSMLAPAVAIAIIPSTQTNAEYYIGATCQVNQQSIRLKLDKFDIQQRKEKGFRWGGDLILGYAYGSKVTIAGQIIASYCGKDIKHAVDITKSSADKSHFISDVSLRNRFRCGPEVLVGYSFGEGIRTFPYIILGYAIEFTQARGSMFAEQDSKKSVIYFGKESANVQGIQMPAVPKRVKFIPTPVLGFGARFYLLGRMFVGIDARCFAKTKREFKTSCTRIDPTGIFGATSTYVTTEEIKFPGKVTHYSVGLTVGVHL